MKKALYVISLSIFLPSLVFAEVDYVRLTPDSLISSATTVNLAIADYDKEINCGGLSFWGIQAIEHQTGKVFSSLPRFVPSNLLNVTFALDMPPGNYEEITFTCSDDGENLAFQYGSLESDVSGDQIIFAASPVSSITSNNIDDEEIVTVSIDGDAISKSGTSTEAVLHVPDEGMVEATSSIAVTEDPSSQTAAVFSAGNEVLEMLVETVPESVIEEIHSTSSITGDTNANGTTTTTF